MKDPLLKKYLDLVKQLWGSFEKIQLVKIPKEENSNTDGLSKLDPFDPKKTVGILVEYMDQTNTTIESKVLIISRLEKSNSCISEEFISIHKLSVGQTQNQGF